ncbi:MAG: TIGR00296 family protein [Nitrososphaerota archaeon]|nr:TIGR00296 family protein [Nitrososphaerota archaeon]
MDATSEENFGSEFFEKDGDLLVSAARESIRTYFKTSRIQAPDSVSKDTRFEKKLGCFVTLKENDLEKSLRGCIGFPEPMYKLAKALPESAVSAAVHDPRFRPIRAGDLQSLLVEVSILTKPSLIRVDHKEIPQSIVIGRDGLIIKWEYGAGLLLPQVAAEFNWNAEEFLCNLSMKAGASPDQWQSPSSMIYKFHAQVFQEISPNGNVILEKAPKNDA